MVVLAMNSIQVAEVVLAFLWAIVAFSSLYSAKHGPCKILLRPIKIFTATISFAWVAIYVVALTGIFSQFRFGTPEVLHALGNGLLIVTVANFILLIFLIDKVLRKCGVE